MTQLSILRGIYGDSAGDLRASYPRNLFPMLGENGVTDGYLRTAPGLTAITSANGEDRGAILWGDDVYRVIGGRLYKLVGSALQDMGAVGFGSAVSMDYSFDLLAVASGGGLFYCDGSGVSQVTDPDLGVVLDVMWIDGYFMTTDGTHLVVTELDDPYAVNPLKYGSSEEDPDPIVALRKVRGEAYALNRYTIENFQNLGSTGFPFQRNKGGLIPKGCVGTKANCYFLETFAFVGGARNEALSVYLAGAGRALNISTPDIDRKLAALTDNEQALIECEALIEKGEQRLLVHLPTETLVYSHQASHAAEGPVWSILASGSLADERYAARHFVLSNGQWIGGSATGVVGYLDLNTETHFGDVAGWAFDTLFMYNGSRGALIQAIELVGQTGLAPLGVDATVFMSFSRDGKLFTNERAISMGQFGQTRKRVQWRPGYRFMNYGMLRFCGASTARASWMRLECQFEALAG